MTYIYRKFLAGLLISLAVIGLFLISPQKASAATYYISTTGLDSNTGGLDDPWLTITTSMYKLAESDTAIVLPGTYGQTVSIPQSNLTLEASGEAVVKGVTVEGSSNTVRGFTITDAAANAGIRVYGDGNLFENNEIYGTKQDGIWFFGSNNTFRGNYIHNILDPSIPDDPHVDCFQTWSFNWNTVNALFEENICDHGRSTGSNQIASITRSTSLELNNITFRNNIFIMHDTGYSPLNVDTLDPLYPLTDIYVYNNTFYNTTGTGTAAIVMDTVTNGNIVNNAVIGYSSLSLVMGGTVTESNNNITGPYGMVDYPNLNFHLQRSSVLIDSGTDNGVTGDYDGTSRPQGTTHDIGAYEYKPLTVTVNQASGQPDPTGGGPINFTVIFSEAVSDFTAGDITFSGSAGPTTAEVTGSGTTYNVAVSGMTGAGNVTISIGADKATGIFGNTNELSTSSDNGVTLGGIGGTAGAAGIALPWYPVSFNAPDLFEIRTGKTSAILYAAPPPAPYTSFYIMYSRKPDMWEYGTVIKQTESSGVISFTINALQQNTTYFFKVAASNNIALGSWSNVLSAKTNSGGQKSYYRYFPID
jgi:hypothetical protein